MTVNDQRAHRYGELFFAEISVSNQTASVQTNITAYAVRADGSTDLVALVSGVRYVAKANETVTNNATGTVSQDSRYSYQWDGYGRLASITSTNASPDFKLEFTYYADGQRATKKVSEWTGSEWTNTYSHAFVWDGWVPIYEKITCHTGATEQVTTREYLFGLDSAGKRSGKCGQEAGGIGGLLAITQVSGGVTNIYLPIYDHQGTTHHLIDSDTKQVVANWDFDPYGVMVAQWGPQVDVCPLLFQTKYRDKETGHINFGYRILDPPTTRWLSPDPAEISSFEPNRFSFARNNPVNNLDALGREIRFDGSASSFSDDERHFVMKEMLTAFRVAHLRSQEAARFAVVLRRRLSDVRVPDRARPVYRAILQTIEGYEKHLAAIHRLKQETITVHYDPSRAQEVAAYTRPRSVAIMGRSIWITRKDASVSTYMHELFRLESRNVRDLGSRDVSRVVDLPEAVYTYNSLASYPDREGGTPGWYLIMSYALGRQFNDRAPDLPVLNALCGILEMTREVIRNQEASQ